MPRRSWFLTAGTVYNRLTVVKFLGWNERSKQVYECRCSCGTVKSLERENLVYGSTRSCGCISGNEKHGMTGTPEYETFKEAKKRCTNPRKKEFPYYGGRGIEFRFESFADFFAEVGFRPSSFHSLNRIDNDGHYEQGNIQWATMAEQAKNRRPRSPNRRRL